MPLITGRIPNLINGVSQQPDSIRLPSQCEVMDNAVPSVVEGLRKRPPTIHLGEIHDTSFGDAFFHTMNRDTNERYLMVITDGNLRVFDIEGNERSVSFPDGKGYLSSTSPQTGFRAVTVNDYTFIVNNQVVVEDNGVKSPNREPEAILFFEQVYDAEGIDLRIYIDGVLRASVDYNQENISTARAALLAYNALRNSLNSDTWEIILKDGPAPNANAGTTIPLGSIIYLRNKLGEDFELSVGTTLGDEGVRVFQGKTQNFFDLPKTMFIQGFHVEVEGEIESAADRYYVHWQGGANDGQWIETMAQDLILELDPATMPHQLISNADGTFTFQQAVWEPRKVGDDDTNPLPSFYKNTISDVFFHRNRLGFISADNVIFSQAGRYFDFFRQTAPQLLDDDPIDLGVAHTKVSILRSAIGYNETLLLFSDQTQFVLSTGTDLLTPMTASITVATEYENSHQAKPVGAGRSIFFTVPRGTYSAMREYVVDGVSEILDAVDITGQVPKYIPNNVFKLTTSTIESAMVVLSSTTPNILYVYNWHTMNDEKLQSAWGRWTFPEGTKILNADFIESDLYLVTEYPEGGVHLEKMALEPLTVEVLGSEGFLYHLDRQIRVTGASFDPTSNTTVIPLPYACDLDGLQVVVAATSPVGMEGDTPPIHRPDNETILLEGNWSGHELVVGVNYPLIYRFSPFILREQTQDGGTSAVLGGNLFIQKLLLDFSDTGYFRVEVRPYPGSQAYTYEFTGYYVNNPYYGTDTLPIVSGQQEVGIRARARDASVTIINDSFKQSQFLSGEWQARYTSFHQR